MSARLQQSAVTWSGEWEEELRQVRERGKWIKATVTEHLCSSRCACEEPVRSLHIPPWYRNEYPPKKKGRTVFKEVPVTVTAKKAAMTYRSRRLCYISKLPDELLLEILRYLVPTGMTFQIFRFARLEYYGEPVCTAVHAFGRPSIEPWPHVSNSEQRASRTTALASVSRVFADLYCGPMYGENSWIVECASSAIESVIVNHDNDGSAPPSWSRSYDEVSTVPWPLTARSAKYVRDLMVLVTLVDGGKIPVVLGQLGGMVGMFGDDHVLSRLRVNIRSAPQMPQTTKAPVFRGRPPRSHLHWSAKADGSHEIKLQVSTSSGEGYEKAAALWEVCEKLQGVKDVTLSGMITEERALRPAMSMQQESMQPSHWIPDGGMSESVSEKPANSRASKKQRERAEPVPRTSSKRRRVT